MTLVRCRVAIIYHSEQGSTAELARAIAVGASAEPDVEVVSHRIVGGDIVEGRLRNEAGLELADSARVVLFGSPTYLGGPSAQFKAFADASSERWSQRRWVDKLAGGFTIGASLNGDQLSTLVYFSILAAQHGMVWAGLDVTGGSGAATLNRLGTQLGLAAYSETSAADPADLATARHFGARMARIGRGLPSAAR